jgi:hypothetical protein
MGFGMGGGLAHATIEMDAVDHRQFVAQVKAGQNPILQDGLQFVATLFQSGTFRPGSLAPGNRTEESPARHRLAVGLAHDLFDVFGEHGNSQISHGATGLYSRRQLRFYFALLRPQGILRLTNFPQ